MKSHYYLKRILPVLIGVLILSAAAVYAAEESITLTTYYPSPYGVYSEMRLYPKDSVTSPCQEGTMYYDQSDHRLMVCGKDPLSGGYVWQPISGLWNLGGSNLYPNDNNWNVGIGMNNPGTKLDVAGTVRATDFTCIDCLGPGDIGDGLGVNEIDENAIQRRVTGTCAPGSSIRVIDVNGLVTCETDDTGGGGGNITIAAPGGSYTGSSFNFVGNVTYSGGDTFKFGEGGGPGGSVFSLTGGAGITLSGAGVSGNTWDPNAGTATISSSGGGGGGALGAWSGPYNVDTVYTAATDGFVTVTSDKGGDADCTVILETPVGVMRQRANPNHDGVQVAMMSPVRKGDTWIVKYPNTGCWTVYIYWIPLGS